MILVLILEFKIDDRGGWLETKTNNGKMSIKLKNIKMEYIENKQWQQKKIWILNHLFKFVNENRNWQTEMNYA